MTADMQQVVNALDDHDGEVLGQDRYRTVNGIVLKIKPVSMMLVNDARARFTAPDVPKVYDKDKEMWEENPNDPEYRVKLLNHLATLGEANHAVFLMRGITVESVPESVEKAESPDWADDIKEFAGIEIPESGRRRLFCWLKYVALATVHDYNTVLNKIVSLSGMTQEVDVARAVESFRDNKAGNTDTGVQPASTNGLGTPGGAVPAGDGA